MLEKLYEAANDPQSKVDKDMVTLLERAWDEVWKAVAQGIKR